MALSADGALLASASSNMVKVWNVRSGACVRSLSGAGFGLCLAFLPGQRHLVLGTKQGGLQVFDITSGEMWEEEAHEGAVWALDVRPDGRGMVSGSADKHVKFWDFEMVEEPTEEGGGGEGATRRRLGLAHTRTLKLSSDVLAVRYSPTKDPARLLLAVALLDCTVKVFFDDSLKFFLSLYGHKLPVLSIDISSDCTLLATGSADKNVKLWGLDFGDCHRSLFAHDDSVTCVRFVPETHFFFTAGKDKMVKYWDGDSYEQVLRLPGHCGEVWALVVAPDGSYAASASHDRSLRTWARSTDGEQVFLEEEREKEREEVFDASLGEQQQQVTADDLMQQQQQDGEGGGAEGGSSERAGKKTIETADAGDRLSDALELATSEDIALRNYTAALREAEAKQAAEAHLASASASNKPAPTLPSGAPLPDNAPAAAAAAAGPLLAPPLPSPLLLGLTPQKHVLKTLRGIKAQELEDALLLLPFAHVEMLISYLLGMLRAGLAPELCCRTSVFLLKLHHNSVVSNRSLLNALQELRTALHRRIEQERDLLGFNLAAMRQLKRSAEEHKTRSLAVAMGEPGGNKQKSNKLARLA